MEPCRFNKVKLYQALFLVLGIAFCFSSKVHAQVRIGKSTSEVSISAKQKNASIKQIKSFQNGIAYWLRDEDKINTLIILSKDSAYTTNLPFKSFLVDARGRLTLITENDSVFSSANGIHWQAEGAYEDSRIFLEKGILMHEENCFTHITYNRFINSYIRYNLLNNTTETYIDADSVNYMMYKQRIIGLFIEKDKDLEYVDLPVDRMLEMAEYIIPQDVFFMKHYAISMNKPAIFWQGDKYVVISIGQEYCELRDSSFQVIRQTSMTPFLRRKDFHKTIFQDASTEKLYFFVFHDFRWHLYEYDTSNSSFHKRMNISNLDIDRVAIYGNKVYYCEKRARSLSIRSIESEGVK